jgi:hypothetical protein
LLDSFLAVMGARFKHISTTLTPCQLSLDLTQGKMIALCYSGGIKTTYTIPSIHVGELNALLHRIQGITAHFRVRHAGSDLSTADKKAWKAARAAECTHLLANINDVLDSTSCQNRYTHTQAFFREAVGAIRTLWANVLEEPRTDADEEIKAAVSTLVQHEGVALNKALKEEIFAAFKRAGAAHFRGMVHDILGVVSAGAEAAAAKAAAAAAAKTAAAAAAKVAKVAKSGGAKSGGAKSGAVPGAAGGAGEAPVPPCTTISLFTYTGTPSSLTASDRTEMDAIKGLLTRFITDPSLKLKDTIKAMHAKIIHLSTENAQKTSYRQILTTLVSLTAAPAPAPAPAAAAAAAAATAAAAAAAAAVAAAAAAAAERQREAARDMFVLFYCHAFENGMYDVINPEVSAYVAEHPVDLRRDVLAKNFCFNPSPFAYGRGARNLHAWQVDFLNRSTPLTLVAAGVGSGKTFAIQESIQRAITNPSQACIVIVPTQELATQHAAAIRTGLSGVRIRGTTNSFFINLQAGNCVQQVCYSEHETAHIHVYDCAGFLRAIIDGTLSLETIQLIVGDEWGCISDGSPEMGAAYSIALFLAKLLRRRQGTSFLALSGSISEPERLQATLTDFFGEAVTLFNPTERFVARALHLLSEDGRLQRINPLNHIPNLDDSPPTLIMTTPQVLKLVADAESVSALFPEAQRYTCPRLPLRVAVLSDVDKLQRSVLHWLRTVAPPEAVSALLPNRPLPRGKELSTAELVDYIRGIPTSSVTFDLMPQGSAIKVLQTTGEMLEYLRLINDLVMKFGPISFKNIYYDEEGNNLVAQFHAECDSAEERIRASYAKKPTSRSGDDADHDAGETLETTCDGVVEDERSSLFRQYLPRFQDAETRFVTGWSDECDTMLALLKTKFGKDVSRDDIQDKRASFVRDNAIRSIAHCQRRSKGDSLLPWQLRDKTGSPFFTFHSSLSIGGYLGGTIMSKIRNAFYMHLSSIVRDFISTNGESALPTFCPPADLLKALGLGGYVLTFKSDYKSPPEKFKAFMTDTIVEDESSGFKYKPEKSLPFELSWDSDILKSLQLGLLPCGSPADILATVTLPIEVRTYLCRILGALQLVVLEILTPNNPAYSIENLKLAVLAGNGVFERGSNMKIPRINVLLRRLPPPGEYSRADILQALGRGGRPDQDQCTIAFIGVYDNLSSLLSPIPERIVCDKYLLNAFQTVNLTKSKNPIVLEMIQLMRDALPAGTLALPAAAARAAAARADAPPAAAARAAAPPAAAPPAAAARADAAPAAAPPAAAPPAAAPPAAAARADAAPAAAPPTDEQRWGQELIDAIRKFLTVEDRTDAELNICVLIHMGADLTVRDEDNHTALTLACALNLPSIVEFLFDIRNADCVSSIGDGYTPLHFAAGSGMLHIVQRMLARGAHINATTTKRGVTPLIYACRQRHADVALDLIQKGADVTVTALSGETALLTIEDDMPEVKAAILAAVAHGGAAAARGGAAAAHGGAAAASGGAAAAHGGAAVARGGAAVARGGAHGGAAVARGGAFAARGGAFAARGGARGGAFAASGGAHGGAAVARGGAFAARGGAFAASGGAHGGSSGCPW